MTILKSIHQVFRLREEIEHCTPDVWDEIEGKITQRIVTNLLQDLDGLPSPEGRLLGEIRDRVKQHILNKGA